MSLMKYASRIIISFNQCRAMYVLCCIAALFTYGIISTMERRCILSLTLRMHANTVACCMVFIPGSHKPMQKFYIEYKSKFNGIP